MKEIQKVIAGIDFSVYSARVLEYAAVVAERNMAEIVAVSVINKRQIDHIREICEEDKPTNLTLEKFLNDETRRRMADMEELFGRMVPKTVPARTLIRTGVPFEQLLQVVDEEQADLMVISSRGRTNFQDYMFGTTSEKVFRHCPVPVLSLNLRE